MGDTGAPGQPGICIITPEWTAYIAELTAWINKWNEYTANGLEACQSAQFSITEVNTFLDTFQAWVETTLDDLDASFQTTYGAHIATYNAAVLNFNTVTDLKYTTILAQIADIKAQIDAVCM